MLLGTLVTHDVPQGRTKSQREIGSQVEGVGVRLIALPSYFAVRENLGVFLQKKDPMIFDDLWV